MKDYTKLSMKEKIRIGNAWLIKNGIKDLKIVKRMITYNANGDLGKRAVFGLDWLKNQDGKINRLKLLTEDSFEEIISKVQIEYRIDNSPNC